MSKSKAFQEWLDTKFSACDACKAQSWKITAGGDFRCDHCGNVLPKFVELVCGGSKATHGTPLTFHDEPGREYCADCGADITPAREAPTDA